MNMTLSNRDSSSDECSFTGSDVMPSLAFRGIGKAQVEWNRFCVLLILDVLDSLRAYLVKRKTC
jgi:hypothetical protein